MLSGFMLPSFGAFTIDGTIILAVGIVAVLGILYKYRENISLTSQDIQIKQEDNNVNHIKFEENVERTKNVEVKEEVEENMEVYEDEKVKIFN